MKNEKINCFALLCAFLISYFYFTNIILGQLTMFTIGKESIWINALVYFISPFFIIFLAKKGNKLRKIQLSNFIETEKLSISFFIGKISLIIYFILTNVFVLLYTIYFDFAYLNTEYDYVVIGIIIILPVIIFSKNINNAANKTQIFPILLISLYFLLFLSNPSEINEYAIEFIPLQNNDSIIKIIIFLIPVLLEPFLIFYIFDFSKQKISKKKMLIPIFLTAIFAIYNILRAGNDFGILLNKIEFPFFQSLEIIQLNEYLENSYNLSIISWIICAIYRLIFTSSLVQHTFNIKNKIIPIIMNCASLFTSLILIKNLSLYEEFKMTLIVVMDSMLIVVFLLTMFYLSKLKDVKNNGKIRTKFN